MNTKDIIRGLLVHINQEIDCEICPYQNVTNCNETLIKDAVKLIESQFRPRGEWISNNTVQIPCNFGRHCSICNYTVEFVTNYCPSCGADMRGENNEPKT